MIRQFISFFKKASFSFSAIFLIIFLAKIFGFDLGLDSFLILKALLAFSLLYLTFYLAEVLSEELVEKIGQRVAKNTFKIGFWKSFFITIAFLSLTALVLDWFGFSLNLRQIALLKIFLIALVFLITKLLVFYLKRFSSEKARKLVFYSFLNLTLTIFSITVYSLFLYGSPLVFEERILNFKVKKQIEINEEPIIQAFTAKSNNLGTVGVRLIVKTRESEGVDFLPEEIDKNSTLINEKADNNFLSPTENLVLEEIGNDSFKLLFRIKEEEADTYFYENVYEFPFDSQTVFYPFGFPLQEESNNKKYLFELSEYLKDGGKRGLKDETVGFFVEKNGNGNLNFYPRYVYSISHLKPDWKPIFLNTFKKTDWIFNTETIQLILIFNFLFINLLIFLLIQKKCLDKFLGIGSLIFLVLIFGLYIFREELIDVVNIDFFKNYFFALFLFQSSLFLINNKDKIFERVNKNNSISLKNKWDLWIYKNGKCLIPMLAIFVLIMIKQIFYLGVGTDEGNTLYALRMLKDGLIIYKDFWFREPGALILLNPLLSLVDISLTFTRLTALFYLVIFLIVLYFTVKNLISKKMALIVTAIYVFGFNIFFPIYSASHNIYYLPLMGMNFLLLFSYLKKKSLLKLFILSILTGLSITIYKGGLFFVALSVIVFLIGIFEQKEKIINVLIFCFTSLIVNIFFLFYFSLGVTLQIVFDSVYKSIILSYVLLFLGVILTLIFYFLSKYATGFLKNFFSKITSRRSVWLLSLFLLIFYFAFNLFSNFQNTALSFWSQGMLSFGFFLLFIFFLNSLLLLGENMLIKVVYALFLFGFLIFSFFSIGKNFHINFSNTYHHFLFLLLSVFTALNLFLIFSTSGLYHPKGNLYLMAIFINTSVFFRHLGLSLLVNSGSDGLVGRPTILAFAFPLFLSFIFIEKPNVYKNIPGRIVFNFYLVFVALVFVVVYQPNLGRSGLIFYDQSSYTNVIEYLNLNTLESDYIFTADLAIAAEVGSKNVLKVSSPWVYREKNLPFYCQKKSDAGYCYSKIEIAKLISLLKPKYIVVSERATGMTFLNVSFDKNNKPINEVIKAEYSLAKQFGRISIFERIL